MDLEKSDRCTAGSFKSTRRERIDNPSNPRDHLFAITIGIDFYPNDSHRAKLNCSVSDADAVDTWLRSDLRVPPKNIVSLRNEQATGRKIREALNGVLENEDIGSNDTFLFYFSGFGGTVNTRGTVNTWPTNQGKLQMILPQDFDASIHDYTQGPRTQPGYGILDVELGNTIERISMKKGGLRSIVILDYCSSGSRGDVDANHAVHDVTLPAYTIPSGALSPPLPSRSHVLLAACEEEKASKYETPKHGYFTYALLDILRNEDLRELTYSELMMKIKQPQYGFSDNRQPPRFEGYNLDRVVFTGELRRSLPTIYNVQAEGDDFILKGGTQDHIVKGAQFAIHTDKYCTSDTHVACIEALEVEKTNTRCSLIPGHSPTLPLIPHDTPLYAIQTLHGKFLRLFINKEDSHYDEWKSLIDNNIHDMRIRSINVVKHGMEADLAISTNGETIEFEVKNPICLAYGLSSLPCRDVRADGPPELLLKILGHASNFFRLLSLSTMDDSRDPNIEVECLSIRPGRYPSSWVREPNSLNLNVNNRIYINLDDKQAFYSFEIKNHHDSECFYVAVFMFDVYSLEIIRYDPPMEQAHSSYPRCELSSLPAKQSLLIGFGHSSSPPRRYFCPPGQDADIGFLKVFLSTKPHGFPSIEQKSPFNDMWSAQIDDCATSHDEELFDSITIPVIQGPRTWLVSMGMPESPLKG
ncbi:hypothetical protein H0H93_004751 [Arthromyces matolae]|nr:hypothetical protein H0H93_004751 [Arthromyces matolae]